MRHRVFIILAVTLFLPLSVRAQGSRKDDIVLNRFGQPVAGATVTVCTSGATGTPCSPLASIFSDFALTQPLANPLTSDGQGNYHFYAAPGRYMIQISGAGVTTTTIADVLLAADPTSPSFQNLNVTQNISALNLTLSGNLTVSGALSSPSALSAPQTGTASPVQLGPNWYAGTASGKCAVPAAPTVAVEGSTGGSIGTASLQYKVALFNRNGTTSMSPATTFAASSGATNRILVQLGQTPVDFSFRSGCYGYRVYVSSDGGTTFWQQNAWTLPVASFATLTRGSNGVVTATSTAAHGFIPGEQIVVAGVTGGVNSFNGTFTLIGQQVNSPTTLFWFQSGAAESANPSTGTGTVIAGLGSDPAGHFAPGDFILSAILTSGTQGPTTNTASIDAIQVALNATCNYATNACVNGQLIVPQGITTLTTPLIVSNQETVMGVNSARAGGKSQISCSWKDPNLGCVMIDAGNGVRVESLDIEAAGHGLMLTGWGPGFQNQHQFVRNNTIQTSDTTGQYSAIYFHAGTWYDEHFENNYLQGGLAAVQLDAISGGWWFFSGARWDCSNNLAGTGKNGNALLSVSSVTDPDRGALRNSFPNGASMVELSNMLTESATGVHFEAVNLGLKLKNVLTADPSPNAGTPAIIRIGADANAVPGNFGQGIVFEDDYFQPASGVPAMIQLVSNTSNLIGGITLRNVQGGQTNAIDYNNVSIDVYVENSSIWPYESATTNKVINTPTGGQPPVVAGVQYDGTTNTRNGMNQLLGCTILRRSDFASTNDRQYWCMNGSGDNSLNIYGGSPAIASNLYATWNFATGGGFRLWQNDGVTPLFQLNALSGANQINLCNPGSPANSKVNLGCPLVDSTGATVKGALTGTSGSLGGSALTAGTCSSTTVAISGATTSMTATASPSSDPGAGFYWLAFVSSSNTVTVRICAAVAGTPTAVTYNVRVIQ